MLSQAGFGVQSAYLQFLMSRLRTAGWARSITLLVGILGLFFCLTTLGFGQGLPSDPTRQALLQVMINAAYSDAENDLLRISRLIEFLPTRKAIIEPGETISDVILREYRFGATNLPRLYKIMETKILAINQLPDPRFVQPGVITVPGIPPRALTEPNPMNPYNDFAVLCSYDVATEKLPCSADFRKGAKEVLVDIWLEVPRILQLVRSKTFPLLEARIASYPMEVDFSSQQGQTSHSSQFLTQEELDQVENLLTEYGESEVDVIILDSGWPTADEFERSRDYFMHLFDRARDYLFLPKRNVEYPQSFHQPINPHCKQVRESLSELEELDRKDLVKVIYLPLSRDQGAAPILEELIELGELIRYTAQTYITPPPDFQRHAHTTAHRVVAQLPVDPAKTLIKSDKALLEALIKVLHFVGDIEHAHFFINESWTVRNKVTFFEGMSTRAVAVVAAGNKPEINIIEKEINFPYMCAFRKDVIAVLNMGRDGKIICNSSVVGERELDEIVAVGFDGTLPDGDCGTSFSAPRVAWFLAAGETMRSPNVKPNAPWLTLLSTRLKAIRSEAKGLSSLLFRPLEYLQMTSEKAQDLH